MMISTSELNPAEAVQAPSGSASADPARPVYEHLIEYLKSRRASDLRALDERMEATLREMGVTFGNNPQQPWICDLLPHVFEAEEWTLIVAGVRQRLRAFDLFLQDVYGPRDILRAGLVPIHPVLGSPHYVNATVGLPRPHNAYLHLSGICLTRGPKGELLVKHHYVSRGSGMAYMMQNRRALARVIPELFHHTAVRSFAQSPLAINEALRSIVDPAHGEPSVVLLSPGPASPVYSAHSFLARRMGVPLVQGGDLLVLDDSVFLKTIEGLKKVDVIYNRVPDALLDPLVLRRDSRLGVPGLVHCMRKGSLQVMNGIGSQLADDRSLLSFAGRIIRFYLSEEPILGCVPTYWLGDIDQREMVLDRPDDYLIQPVIADDLRSQPLPVDLAQVRREGSRYVAQPRESGELRQAEMGGKKSNLSQDHIVFALRSGLSFEVLPGALTRVFSGSQLGSWISKDTWVRGENPEAPARTQRSSAEQHISARQVTSRVADSFYWLGRYLERAYHQAYLIQVIETLETEELNSAERKLYRPMWNRLLPPLEKSAGESRRSITTRVDRYRLVLLPEPGTVVSTFNRAIINAESLLECLSPEAWATLSDLRVRFQRVRYRENIDENECARTTRRLSEIVTRLIPQFFAVADNTMLADDGWRFCEVGQMIERALITANSVAAIGKSFAEASEIELSAFLRLLGTRDAYRRVYQMRAEPVVVLNFLWQNPQAPRSIIRCLRRCARLLRESSAAGTLGTRQTLEAIEKLSERIAEMDWARFLRVKRDEHLAEAQTSLDPEGTTQVMEAVSELVSGTLGIHNAISDGFLNHQALISQVAPVKA